MGIDRFMNLFKKKNISGRLEEDLSNGVLKETLERHIENYNYNDKVIIKKFGRRMGEKSREDCTIKKLFIELKRRKLEYHETLEDYLAKGGVNPYDSSKLSVVGSKNI